MTFHLVVMYYYYHYQYRRYHHHHHHHQFNGLFSRTTSVRFGLIVRRPTHFYRPH